MTNAEIIKHLQEMLATAQGLASQRDPALEGDIQIILTILVDKLRYLDPTNEYAHQVEYE
ncbi:MAG: hypothetical protein FVQ83_12700 [Chloroflexi bacterium]|nr:hypothetical protein [Chloroflexota bacterium]